MHWQQAVRLCALALAANWALAGCSTGPAVGTVTGEVTLEAGKTYDLKIEYYEGRVGAVARLVGP